MPEDKRKRDEYVPMPIDDTIGDDMEAELKRTRMEDKFPPSPPPPLDSPSEPSGRDTTTLQVLMQIRDALKHIASELEDMNLKTPNPRKY